MLALRRLLVPTDHSDCAARAMETAAFLARRTGAEIRLLHVPPFPESVAPRPPDALPDGVATHYLVRNAPTAADAIIEEAADADLVVMGTHSRRGLRRALLGSTTEETLRLAITPVWAVGPGHASAEAVRRILVPVDFADPAEMLEASLRTADAVAATTGAAVDVLHAAYLPTLPAIYSVGLQLEAYYPDIEARTVAALHDALDRLVALERQGSVTVRLGTPAATILETAAARQTDLLVLPTHGRRGLARLALGSVAETVLRRAPCAVLALKPSGRPLPLTDD